MGVRTGVHHFDVDQRCPQQLRLEPAPLCTGKGPLVHFCSAMPFSLQIPLQTVISHEKSWLSPSVRATKSLSSPDLPQQARKLFMKTLSALLAAPWHSRLRSFAWLEDWRCRPRNSDWVGDELDFVSRAVSQAPHNESSWNYLLGFCQLKPELLLLARNKKIHNLVQVCIP